MKKYLLWLVFLIFPIGQVFAHLANQQPFFKINGKYADLYPVPLTSLENFQLAQDLAPENYLVGQKLNLEIDTTKFGVAYDIISKTKYRWDFGDGTNDHGLATNHTYAKMGSYVLSIYADDGTSPKPQLFESVLINVLPNLDYKLPKAVISVNGNRITNSLTDILNFNFGEEGKFDASSSVASSAKIVQYFWDFGDKKSSTDAVILHRIVPVGGQGQVFPVLRVVDENGFISDTFAEIDNSNFLQKSANPIKVPATPAAAVKKPSQLKYTIMAILGFLALALVGRFILMGRNRAKNQVN